MHQTTHWHWISNQAHYTDTKFTHRNCIFFILYFVQLNMHFCIYSKCYFVFKYINIKYTDTVGVSLKQRRYFRIYLRGNIAQRRIFLNFNCHYTTVLSFIRGSVIIHSKSKIRHWHYLYIIVKVKLLKLDIIYPSISFFLLR